MKRFFYLIFIILPLAIPNIATGTTVARCDAASGEKHDLYSNPCPAGCNYTHSSAECTQCPANTFNHLTNATCRNCPTGYTSGAGSATYEDCTTSCEVNCTAPQKPANSKSFEYNETSTCQGYKFCTELPSESSDSCITSECKTYTSSCPCPITSVECNDHYEPKNNNTCTPKVYDITLDYDGGTGSCSANGSSLTATKTIYHKYKTGISLLREGGTYGQSLTINLPTKNKYYFGGYFTEKNGKGTQVTSANSSCAQTVTYNAIKGLNTTTTLYAHWTGKPYSIQYKASDDATTAIKTITAQFGTAQTAADYKTLSTNAPAGKIFSKWKCTNCGNNQSEVTPGEKITEPASEGTTITLTAQWTDCPAGYYCTGNTQKNCPMGSTSDAGTTTEAKCYMTKDTIFTDNNGTITIELPTKIYRTKQ